MPVKFIRPGCVSLGCVFNGKDLNAGGTVSADFYIDLVTALWLGFLGACIGSFLNVVAYRLPLGMSVVWKPSHCPKCNQPIRARDNVPVWGWLWLRGKCRDCGAPIAPRYAIVEAIMGGVFFVLAYAELFRGGANLLGGTLTNLRGASDIVWNPHWPVIGLYAYHSLLASFLMTLVLLRLDKNISVKKFLCWSVLILFLYPWPAILYSQIGR